MKAPRGIHRILLLYFFFTYKLIVLESIDLCFKPFFIRHAFNI